MIHRRFALVFLAACALPTLARTQSIVTSAFPVTPIGRAGDVTGDGIDDLLVQIGSNFQVLDATTLTSIPYLQRSAALAPSPWHYTPVGDYDGDGKDDLFYWREFNASFPAVDSVVSGADGSTLFSTPATITVGGGADFDGDGRSDLLYAENLNAFVISARTGAVLYQINGSTGAMGPWYQTVTPAGDENGDGQSDVIVSYNTYISYGLLRLVVSSSGITTPVDRAMAVGDVNGDGTADFWTNPVASALPRRIVSGGTYATVWSLPNLDVFRLGDVDGDGFDDIATGFNFPVVYQTLSGATHAPLSGAAPTGAPMWLGDLDGDGRAECVSNGLRYEWSDPALPIASRMLRRGKPGTTSDGRKPYLVTRGHCGLGRTAFFDMRGGMPNGATFLVYGAAASADLASLGAPGNTSYTTFFGGLAFAANGNGVARYQATMPVSPSLLGASLSLQSVVADPAANALGLVTSNAVDITTNN